jgi:hypothetical protein
MSRRIVIAGEMAKIENWFTHHPPDQDQLEDYRALRSAALVFATVIVERVPDSADRTAALRKVREAVMTANAAIACGGR